MIRCDLPIESGYMLRPAQASLLSVLLLLCVLSGCSGGGNSASPVPATTPTAVTPLYLGAVPLGSLQGTVKPVRDPSVIHVGATWYLFLTDNSAWSGTLPILCSTDTLTWKQCGSVFPQIPAWIHAKLPAVTNLWAPDISFFNGLYHVYYVASLFGTESTILGLATNTTLDPADPNYKWVDRGSVLESAPGDPYNALDPNILVDTDSHIWLSYGSYWNGIAQREIDPVTGLLKDPSAAPVALASRPAVQGDPIEGSAQLIHNGYYYLFASIDTCCNADLTKNNYKMVVGRSTSPHGPFLAQDGIPMLQGDSTLILTGDGTHWVGVGGGTPYNDPVSTSTVLVFHAQAYPGNGTASLFFKTVTWVNDWPTLN